MEKLSASIFDVSLNGFLIVTIFVNLPLGLGGFVCRALQHLLDVLEAWLARKMFFLPFLGFFEMVLFFLSSWILGRRRTCPIHLRMCPRQRQNISRRSRLRQPMRMFLAQGQGTSALWKVLSVSKRYCLLPGEQIMAWSGLGQQEDPRWSPGRGCSGPGFLTLSCHDENRDH